MNTFKCFAKAESLRYTLQRYRCAAHGATNLGRPSPLSALTRTRSLGSLTSTRPLLNEALKNTPRPVEAIQRLGKDVWLIEGDKSAKSGGFPPDVVVIFGWMDGKISHIQKYSSAYRTLFPASSVLVVQSHSNFFWSSKAERAASLHPAISYLDSAGITNDIAPSDSVTSLHLHVFSNGGAAQMTTLGEILRNRRATGSHNTTSWHTLPARSIVIDSAPGGDALKGLVTAFMLPVPAWAKAPVAILVSCAWAFGKAYELVFRPKPFFVNKIRADLLDPEVLPSYAKRLYIYSKTDAIILAEDIEKHIAGGKQAKLDIRTEVYENSPHVSHARTDGDRYWKAVLEMRKECLPST